LAAVGLPNTIGASRVLADASSASPGTSFSALFGLDSHREEFDPETRRTAPGAGALPRPTASFRWGNHLATAVCYVGESAELWLVRTEQAIFRCHPRF